LVTCPVDRPAHPAGPLRFVSGHVLGPIAARLPLSYEKSIIN